MTELNSMNKKLLELIAVSTLVANGAHGAIRGKRPLENEDPETNKPLKFCRDNAYEEANREAKYSAAMKELDKEENDKLNGETPWNPFG